MSIKVIKMDMKRWNRHMQQLGSRFMPTVERGILAGGMRCIPFLQQRTMQAKPASSRGRPGAVDTGLYKAAWRSSPIPRGVRVFNLRPYSGVIEFGRRPAAVNREGIQKLKTWAKRNLNLNEKQAERAAFAIARSMTPKSKGGKGRKLRARKVLTGGEKKLIKIVEKEILQELDRELGRK